VGILSPGLICPSMMASVNRSTTISEADFMRMGFIKSEAVINFPFCAAALRFAAEGEKY